MTWARDLDRMRRLTEVAMLVQQGRMAELRRREEDTRARIAVLDAGRSARAEALNGTTELDAARRGGADPLWQRWSDRRRETLTAELARLLARQEAMRRQLARATGRHEVACRLSQQARATRKGNRV